MVKSTCFLYPHALSTKFRYPNSAGDLMSVALERGYSAPVTLRLHVGDEVLKVASVGPDRIMLRDQRAVREGEAVLVITIGDQEERTNVTLKNSNATDGTVNYTECR